MRPTDKTGKKIHAWAKRVHKGIYHDKEVSDAAKAAFRRAAYGKDTNVLNKDREEGGESNDCDQNDNQTNA